MKNRKATKAGIQGVVVAAAFALSACSHQPEPVGTDNSSSPSTATRPSIHLDQTSVLTVDGKPQEEGSYRTLLSDCQKSGEAVHALSEDDAARIGRIHIDAWIGPDKQSRRREEWHQDVTATCQFILVHKDTTEIVDASGRSTLIDGMTHQVDVQELGAPTPVVALPPNDGEMDEAAKKAGWTKLDDAKAKDASCAIWQNAQGSQLCVWTGGGKWGYSSYGVDALKDGVSPGDAVVLWAHPGQGAAWLLDTHVFTVGGALNSIAFKVPDSVSPGQQPP